MGRGNGKFVHKLFQLMMNYQEEALLGISVENEETFHFVYANEKAKQWLKLPELGKPLQEILTFEDFEMIGDGLRTAILSGEKIDQPFASFHPFRLGGDELYIFIVLHRGSHPYSRRDRIQATDLLERYPDNSPDAIIIGNASGKIVYVNPAFERLFEWTWEEIVGLNIDYVPIVPGHLMDEVRELYLKSPYKAVPPIATSERMKKDGSVINVSVQASAIMDQEGSIRGITAVFRQMTDQNDVPEKVTSQQLYKSLFQWNPDPVFMIDLKGHFISANPACEKLTDFSIDELMNQSFAPLVVPEDLPKVMRHFSKSSKGTPQTFECGIFRKDGNRLELNITNIPIIVDGEVVGVYGIAKDVTEQKATEAKIQHMAYYDQLTDLPNRALFMEQLTMAIRQSAETGDYTAVVYVDVDRFKSVNDSYGHAFGDRFLKHVAAKLSSCVSETQTLARMGGDEFTVILPHVTGESEAVQVAKRILTIFEKALFFEGRTAYIGVSIGISLSKGLDYSADMLVTQADIAMYNVKQHGKSGFKVYSSDFDHHSSKKRLEHDLPGALETEAIKVFFQPIVHIASGQVSGLEALVRWQHPEYGWVSPEEIIPLAEETGLVVRLGKSIFRKSCLAMKKLMEEGHSHIRMAVNLSIRQLQQADFIESVRAVLDEIQLPPSFIELEVTESLVMEDKPLVVDHLNKLRGLGMKVSIDDFGTGYASLSYLQQLPIDKIKIDRMFIRNIENDQSGTIPSAIVNLARALDLDVIAEGIETPEQFIQVKSWGCDEMQGYLFSRPLPYQQLRKLLQSGKTLSDVLS